MSDNLVSRPVALSVCGNILNAISFAFLGPLPAMANIFPSVALIDGCVAMVGVGYALILVSTFSRAHKLAMANGFKPDIGTSLMISSKCLVLYHNNLDITTPITWH